MWPRRDVGHPPTYSAEVEGRVELYICFPFGPSWPVIGRTLPSVGCAWTGFVCLREYGRVTGSFERGNELSGSNLYVGHPVV